MSSASSSSSSSASVPPPELKAVLDLDLQPFVEKSIKSFQLFRRLVGAHATHRLLDLDFLSLAQSAGDDGRFDPIFAPENWATRSLYAQPKYAFKPLVPFQQTDHPLATFYNDLYGLLFAKGSETLVSIDQSLSNSAVKWTVYQTRILKPFLLHLRNFALAIKASSNSKLEEHKDQLSRQEKELAVWNRFIAPVRLLLLDIQENELKAEQFAAKVLLKTTQDFTTVTEKLSKTLDSKGDKWLILFDSEYKSLMEGISAPLNTKVDPKDLQPYMQAIDAPLMQISEKAPRSEVQDLILTDFLKANTFLGLFENPHVEDTPWTEDFKKALIAKSMEIVEKLMSHVTKLQAQTQAKAAQRTADRANEEVKEEGEERGKKKVRTAGEADFKKGKTKCDSDGKVITGPRFSCPYCEEPNYCSPKCQRQAWEGSHSAECKEYNSKWWA